jgi:hypothetical protein
MSVCPNIFKQFLAAAGLAKRQLRKTLSQSRLALPVYLCLCAIFGFAIITGKKIAYLSDEFAGYTMIDLLLWLVVTLLSLAVCLLAHCYICHIRESKHKKTVPPADKRYWLICSAILFCCWFVYLLFYLPASLSTDSLIQIDQAQGIKPPSNYQPYFHTLLIALFVQGVGTLLGNANFGIAAYALFQMAGMACVLGYLLYFLACEGVSRQIRKLLLVFFAVNPLIATFSFTVWKDIPFSCAFLLLTIMLYRIVRDGDTLLRKPRFLIALALTILALCLLRNNGAYIGIAVSLVLLLTWRSRVKQLLPALGSALLLFVLITVPGYRLLQVTPTPFSESLAIPLQQIGYTCKYGTLSEQQSARLTEYLMPPQAIAEAYQPHISDGIKFSEGVLQNTAKLEQDKLGFIALWADIGINNPDSYAKAAAIHMSGLWKLGVPASTISAYYDPVTQSNLFGDTSKVFRYWSDRAVSILSKLPVTSLLTDNAVVVWLTVFALAMLFTMRRRTSLLVLLPSLVLILTLFIATPISTELRYMLGCFMALPVIALTLTRLNAPPDASPGAIENASPVAIANASPDASPDF